MHVNFEVMRVFKDGTRCLVHTNIDTVEIARTLKSQLESVPSPFTYVIVKITKEDVN